MKSWRVLGLVWAVLSLGQVAACGGGGGGGKSDGGERDGDVDTDSEVEETPLMEDSGKPGATEDTGTGSTTDAGADATMSMDATMSCEPKSCEDLGLECGSADDGCGGVLADCGKCKAPETCGAITKNMCDCKPKTCDEMSSDRGVKVCGAVDNGCGTTIQCGGNDVCGANKTCGGAGVPDQCGCTPNLAACAGKECGTASDGCGNTVQCGANAGACGSDARQCSAQNKCECKTTDAAFCAGKCGPKTLDGCSIDCGVCPDVTCAAGASCDNCRCPLLTADPEDDQICAGSPAVCCDPEPVATTCAANYQAACGTRRNNCGQVVDCGSACTGSNVCVENLCISPQKAALLGDYAMRSETWIEVVGSGSRAEGLNYVNITLNKTPAKLGELVYTEAPCGNRAYVGNSSTPQATLLPGVTTKILARPAPLQVPGTVAGLPGPSTWVKDAPPPADATNGWRRGRPTYCPMPGGTNGTAPGPKQDDPSYAPANDTYSMGGKKAWLGQAVCNCPEQEIAKRAASCASKPAAERTKCQQNWCVGVAPDQFAACVANWAQNVLPWGVSAESADTEATDCRIIDEDADGWPGLTVEIGSGFLKTTTRSTTITSVRYWGAVDLTNRKHTAVSFDMPDSLGANVACDGLDLFCGAGAGSFCPPYLNGKRSNLIDFSPVADWRLLQKGPSTTDKVDGPCFRIWDNQASLFAPYTIVVPPAVSCRGYDETPGPVLVYPEGSGPASSQ